MRTHHLPLLTLLALSASLLGSGCASSLDAEDSLHAADAEAADEIAPAMIVHADLAPRLPSVVTNRYVVRLRDDAGDRGFASTRRLAEVAAKDGAVQGHVFEHTIHGFSVVNLSDAALETIRRDPDVLSVEVDEPLSVDELQSTPGWGLDRLDDKQGLDGSYWYESAGAGVHIYVVDNGVRGDHVELVGRIGAGANTFDTINPSATTVGLHGTAVASVAAGKTKGVARSAVVHPIRVGEGRTYYTSDVVAGIDWVSAHAIKPAVLNSSHTGHHPSLAAAYERAIANGITVIRSAGNSAADACEDLSNTVPSVVVVGATGSDDRPASFSNHGPCITLSAPGVMVSVASSTSATATTEASGTSFSAPYVAGVAAVMLGRTPTLGPAAIKRDLSNVGWEGVLQGLASGTPNVLANSTSTLVKPASPKIDSGTPGSLSTTYVWTAPYLDGLPNTWVWEENVGGTWKPVSNRRTYWRNIKGGSYATIKLRVTQTIDYFGTLYPTVTSYTSFVTPTLEEEPCTNLKICE